MHAVAGRAVGEQGQGAAGRVPVGAARGDLPDAFAQGGVGERAGGVHGRVAGVQPLLVDAFGGGAFGGPGPAEPRRRVGPFAAVAQALVGQAVQEAAQQHRFGAGDLLQHAVHVALDVHPPARGRLLQALDVVQHFLRPGGVLGQRGLGEGHRGGAGQRGRPGADQLPAPARHQVVAVAGRGRAGEQDPQVAREGGVAVGAGEQGVVTVRLRGFDVGDGGGGGGGGVGDGGGGGGGEAGLGQGVLPGAVRRERLHQVVRHRDGLPDQALGLLPARLSVGHHAVGEREQPRQPRVGGQRGRRLLQRPPRSLRWTTCPSSSRAV
ncbi:hypothetical protein ACFQ0M_46355 [Kitasatospora aburaviensis]